MGVIDQQLALRAEINTNICAAILCANALAAQQDRFAELTGQRYAPIDRAVDQLAEIVATYRAHTPR